MRRSLPAFWPLCFLAAGGLMLTVAQAAEPATLTSMTSEQDHQNIMDHLPITVLRPGADGFNPRASNAQNTGEAKANPYPMLPNPLTLHNGKPVTTAKTWQQEDIAAGPRQKLGLRGHTTGPSWPVFWISPVWILPVAIFMRPKSRRDTQASASE